MSSVVIPDAIRPAEWDDLAYCLELDASYESDMVWQMHLSPGAGPEGVAVSFRAARRPRTQPVPYPRSPQELRGNWHQQDGFLVAVQQSIVPGAEAGTEEIVERIIGYVDLHEQRWQRAAWVQNLVVDRPFRRRGVGSALLRAAAAWARGEQLRRLILEASTKNGAAIHFFHKHGADFCGFNDRYYTNGDIAVFFEYRL